MHLTSISSRIYVAGHLGMVGSAIERVLRSEGYTNLILRSIEELDLIDQGAARDLFEAERPEFVVVAAARVGGILANSTYPADFLYDNLAIQNNVIRAAFDIGVSRLLFLGSTCIYPKHAKQPIKEEYLLTGPLEPTNEWYAIAKIAGVKLCEALRKQHGVDFISMMPTNLYGPGDNYDLKESHVLPALIRKFHEAKGGSGENDRSVTVWGSGKPMREFLYVDDLARACLHVLKTPEDMLHAAAPDGMLNAGVGQDLSISDLAETVRDALGSTSKIVFDSTKPDGTPRKLVDASRLMSLGWKPETRLTDGIRKSYDWYLEGNARL